MTPIEMSIEILRKTEDGEKLAPQDLKLVETAVNGYLTEAGEVAFYELFARVESGEYRPPWLQGVENLTRDHVGYVYWRGKEIEHWDSHLAYSDRGKGEAEELARRCMILEAKGEKVNTTTVVWKWED